MESDKQHFRHILLFYYRKGKNAVQARKKLTDVYGEGVLTVRQCQNCFAKFRSGNFDVKDALRSGRPVEADKDAIKALVDANRRITTREIGLRLNLSNSTVYDHLKGLGLSSKLDVWAPHVLTERNLCRSIDVYDSLFKRHENDPFLKRIITGDEKRSWSEKDEPAQTISKADIHQKKVMLSVWKAVRATLILIPLLGLHYVVTPFRPVPRSPGEAIYETVSAIVTSFQGLSVALLFCFFNGEVIALIRKKWNQALLMRGRRMSYAATTVSVSILFVYSWIFFKLTY
ncbi:histone-lysine N-methyltransferase SETMAR [Trichonephila clavipes]|nr:histone-lysine N-methyltransferase SETMAR [Trichonephila clavipes]